METAIYILMYLFVFLFGITIGSFLNVCIYRIPKKENIVKIRSHCMTCGYQLQWYDLFPLFSFLFLGGKCRKCKTKLSWQYPAIEFINGVLYLVLFAIYDLTLPFVLYALMSSALLALSLIDWRTFEIPVGFNYFIAALGLVRLVTDFRNWPLYVIGACSVGLALCILYFASGGRAIGGGDVKLMGACGLLLGWKLILLAFCLGCILAAVIHLIRMKVSGAERMLAMGPYLSAGVYLAVVCGAQFLTWYLGTMGLQY